VSFFDDEDEPRTASQTPARRRPTPGASRSGRPRPSRGGSGPSGGGRGTGGSRRASGAPIDRAAIRNRRLGFGVLGVVVVILMAVGIHGCEVSSRNSALKDYTNSVYSLSKSSNGLSTQLFYDLSHSGGASGASTLYKELVHLSYTAELELQKAQGFSVPGQMDNAQRNFVQTLQLRHDGLESISVVISAAFGTGTTATSALAEIAAAMADFYASDVVYKVYAAKNLAEALNSAAIPFGGASSQQIYTRQFLPNLGWLDVGTIATRIGGTVPVNNSGPLSAGTHGDALTGVTVGGTTLSPTSTNAIAASPAPTFTLSVDNDSQNASPNVGCSIKVKGISDSGHSTIPTIAVQATQTCSVTLKSAPPPGQYQVTATVEKVRGESNLANNTMTFPVTFQ
jgi:hypothetical protein